MPRSSTFRLCTHSPVSFLDGHYPLLGGVYCAMRMKEGGVLLPTGIASDASCNRFSGSVVSGTSDGVAMTVLAPFPAVGSTIA